MTAQDDHELRLHQMDAARRRLMKDQRENQPPADPDRHRPGDRVLVSVVPRRPRQSATVLEVREVGRGLLYCLVRLQDGRELVRQHSELGRSGWQPSD